MWLARTRGTRLGLDATLKRHMRSSKGRGVGLVVAAGVACLASSMHTVRARAEPPQLDNAVAAPLPSVVPVAASTPAAAHGRHGAFKIVMAPITGANDVSNLLVETASHDFSSSPLFRVADVKGLPVNLTAEGFGIDPAPWKLANVDAVIKGQSSVRGANLHVELRLFMPASGADVQLRRELDVAPTALHAAMHQFDNEVVRRVTGVAGSFGTHLVFGAAAATGQKAIFEIESDGQDLKRLPTASSVALAPFIGSAGIFYAGATTDGGFALFRVGVDAPVLRQQGLVMGATVKGTKMAVVVSHDGQSDIFVGGADGTGLQKVTNGGINTHPAFGPAGQLAFVSNKGGNPQVYVDGKRVTTRGMYNMAPTWCADPDGPKIVFMGRDGAGWDIFSVEPSGDPQTMQRLTQDQGSNTYPACSPDGRTIAFFSTRGGLFTMTTQGQSQQKIANAMGESLRWEGN
jgi:TolB protein